MNRKNDKKENSKCFCPVCKSSNIKDISKYESNGILGPGYRSWQIDDVRECQDCGVHFKPVKDNCNEN